MTPVPSTLDRRFLVGAAFLTVFLSAYAMRGADADLWGHLLYGQLFLDNGGQIVADPYAYTTQGRQWSTHEYVAQMALAAAYGLGGTIGLILLKTLLALVALGFLYACLRESTADPRLAGPLLILVSISVGQWCVFRPQVFTFALFALFVFVLFRHLLQRRSPLWLLPILMPLWVNVHGGFLAGIGAVGLVLLLRGVQALNAHGWKIAPLLRHCWPLGLTLLACFVGTLINPLGWRLWPYLATELSYKPNRQFIQEWLPILFDGRQTFVEVLFVALVLLLLGTGVLAQWRPGKIAGLAVWQWLLACLPLGYMASQSVRHIPIFTIWVTPILGLLLVAVREAWGERRRLVWTWMMITTLILALAMLRLWVVVADPAPVISTAGPVLGNKGPFGLQAFLRANQLKGRLYTPLWWGSYLSFELHPAILVSCDGRNVTLFDPDTITTNLTYYSETAPDSSAPLAHGSDFLAVPTEAPGLQAIRQDPHWELLYEDPEALLFVRRDEAHQDLRERKRRGEFHTPPLVQPSFFPERRPTSP